MAESIGLTPDEGRDAMRFAFCRECGERTPVGEDGFCIHHGVPTAEAKAMTAPRYTAGRLHKGAEDLRLMGHPHFAAMLSQAAETERQLEAHEKALEAFRAELQAELDSYAGDYPSPDREVTQAHLDSFDRRFGRTP